MGQRLHPVPVGWTLETWAAHSKDMREMQDKLDAMNDRRLMEVQREREKALQIKERADDKALDLAREIQKYKDEKANELREQISSERGHYAAKGELQASIEKVEAQLKPINDYIAQERGKGAGADKNWQVLTAIGALILVMIALTGGIVTTVLYVAKLQSTPIQLAVPTVPMK